MIHIQLLDLFDARLLVVYKDLKVNTPQQIQVHLITIVADGHNEGAILIQEIDLF